MDVVVFFIKKNKTKKTPKTLLSTQLPPPHSCRNVHVHRHFDNSKTYRQWLIDCSCLVSSAKLSTRTMNVKVYSKRRGMSQSGQRLVIVYGNQERTETLGL